MTEFDFDRHLSEHLSDADRRRRYAQNSVIIDVAVALNKALQAQEATQRDLAERLGKTESFVSQVLSGGANVTLRTLGDFAWGLDCSVDLVLSPIEGAPYCVPAETWNAIEVPKATESDRHSSATDTQLALAA